MGSPGRKDGIVHFIETDDEVGMMATTNYIMGMDEAGRGAVIGPLVMVSVILKSDDQHKLQQLGIKDSKMYTGPKRSEKRRMIASEIKKIADHVKIIEISAEEITNDSNLTRLQMEKATHAWCEFMPTEAWFDAIGPLNYFCNTFLNIIKDVSLSNFPFSLERKEINLDKATIIIKDRFGVKRSITVLNKGDQKIPIISAASIIAKDHRDQRIREIERTWNLEEGSLGSGYPNANDKRLLDFLRANEIKVRNRTYPFIRYKWNWEPLQNILKNQTSLKDFL